MKNEFIKYLKSIGITEALHERIKMIFGFYTSTNEYAAICRDEITDIFITDYIKEDGSREYANLWFFSPKYCMEAKLFITQDDFDIAPIRNRVVHWEIKKKDYDFKKATEKSRLYLGLSFDTGMKAEFKASKENCDYFRKIFLRYIVPNLKE